MYKIDVQTNGTPVILVGDGPTADLFDVIRQCREAGIERVAVRPASFGFTSKAEEIDRLLYLVGFDVEE